MTDRDTTTLRVEAERLAWTAEKKHRVGLSSDGAVIANTLRALAAALVDAERERDAANDALLAMKGAAHLALQERDAARAERDEARAEVMALVDARMIDEAAAREEVAAAVEAEQEACAAVCVARARVAISKARMEEATDCGISILARTGADALAKARKQARREKIEEIAAWIEPQRNDVPATGAEFAAAIRALLEDPSHG